MDQLFRYKLGQMQSPDPLDVTNYAWGKRMFEKDAPVIQNPDGSHSTHLMAAETDEDGNWWAFPTIVREDGELKKLSKKEAFKWNLDNNEAVAFGPDKERALSFAEGGYKIGTPLEQ